MTDRWPIFLAKRRRMVHRIRTDGQRSGTSSGHGVRAADEAATLTNDAWVRADPDGSVPAVAGPDHQVERSRYRGGLHAGIRDAHMRAHPQYHRIPAARVRAIDARIATAQVSRVSLSFTLVHLSTETRSEPATGRPRGPLRAVEVPGFASPPHGGFALDGRSTEDDHRLPRHRRCPSSRQVASRRYSWRSTLAGGSPMHHPATGS
jgi:hypothetical protein